MENIILDPRDGPDNSGEIATYARNVFMGYLGDEGQTRASFTDDEKYFRSGDCGSFDSDGFLTVTGRLKEIAITSAGKNIAPAPVEAAVKAKLGDVVSYAVLVADKRKFPTALLTLKVEVDPATQLPTDKLDARAREWCRNECGEEVLTTSDFVRGKNAEKLHAGLAAGIEEANENVENKAARVKGFRVVEHEFSLPGGELGPTLKRKRFFIMDKHKSLIEDMYNTKATA